MLHEARDRQKLVDDVQHLRDMQHKVDSEYQACLRRQEYRRDPNEKKRDQFWGQGTSERFQLSSGSSSKQSSSEEDYLTEPKWTKMPSVTCDSRLPAIDQTSVKQKHKSTMTPRKLEKVGPSKPSPDPVVQQEGPMCAGETKLKRPTQERRNLTLSSQLMRTPEKPVERAKKGEPSAVPQKETHSALSQPFQGTSSPPLLSESLGPLLAPTAMRGPRRAPFRFRDEDFSSKLSLNTGQENDDMDEEIHMEEELLLAGMHSPRSPSNYQRSRFLETSTTPAKNKNLEENAENHRANSLRRSDPKHGSLRISNPVEPVAKQSSVGQRMSQDPRLPDGESVKENDSGGSENEKKAKWDTKSEPRRDSGVSPEDVPSDCISMENRSAIHDCERDWQNYLNGSRNSFDCLLSGRPAVPRSSVNSPYNTPGPLIHSALIDDVPVDLSVSSVLVHSSGPEENSRFNVHRPLSPIRNRNPYANAENHNYLLVNSTHEFDIRGTESITLTRQPQGVPLYAEDLLLNPQGSFSLVDSPSPSPARRDLQGRLHVPETLQENIPFTFIAVSDFPNPNDHGATIAISGFTEEKGAAEIKADPEKLKKLQESLLEEDSEEEGDLCRICQIARGSPTNPLLEPCGCVGSLQFVHQECLKKWLKVKITSGADLSTVKTCEMCKQGLLVDLDDFNMTEFYQKHRQSLAQNELMNSGLYLVLLLHLYEQRFAELMRLNYRRVLRERSSRNYPQPRPEENERSGLGFSFPIPERRLFGHHQKEPQSLIIKWFDLTLSPLGPINWAYWIQRLNKANRSPEKAPLKKAGWLLSNRFQKSLFPYSTEIPTWRNCLVQAGELQVRLRQNSISRPNKHCSD